MQLDHKELESKNQQLGEAYKKKCKDNGQLHKLYQQAKQRQVHEHMAEAAEQDASHVVQSMGRDFGTGDYNTMQPNQGRTRSDESDGLRFGPSLAANPRVHGFSKCYMKLTGLAKLIAGAPTAQSQTTTNRSHLPPPGPNTGFLYRDQNLGNRAGPQRLNTPLRNALSNLDMNSYSHGSMENFGLGTGMKFGRPPQGTYYPPRGQAGSTFGGR